MIGAMRLPRAVRVGLKVVAMLLLVAIISIGSIWIYFHPSYQRTDGVVYGQRHGRDLRLDVIRPAQPKGLGILLMVSGGWKSGNAGSLPPWMVAPLLRHGYTVFAVYHVSQPQATVMEIAEDV